MYTIFITHPPAVPVLLRDKNSAESGLSAQTDYAKQFQATDYHRYCYGSKKKIKYIRNRPEPAFTHEIDDLVA